MGQIAAVCVSERRGTPKRNVNTARFLPGFGVEGDAHGGNWHRQVSLLAAEEIDSFRAGGEDVPYGAFGENLVVRGLDLPALPVGTLLRCGTVLLEITQIGKECHTRCAIARRTGTCVMPRAGVFARVLAGGAVFVGDEITVEPRTEPAPWRAAVITLSDSAFRGEREDASGPAVRRRLEESGYEVIEQLVLPDEPEQLKAHLIRLCAQRQPDLILTTGGTGFSPRDRTPEATLAVGERVVPGIPEAVRAASLTITPRAMLSRAVAVIRGRTLIVNLPGSPKACMESMDVFLDVLPHAFGLLRDEVRDCAR